AVDVNLIQLRHDLLAEAIAHRLHLLHFVRQFQAGDFARCAESDDSWHVQRAGAHAALMSATIDLGDELDTRVATTNVESADALRSVNLVSGDRSEVNVVIDDVERSLAS